MWEMWDAPGQDRDRHRHRLPLGKSSGGGGSNLFPRAMGTGQAGTGLGERKKGDIPARDLGKKLPKGAVEEEEWRQHGKGLGEQAGQVMPGSSWVGSSHQLLKSFPASFPTQTINYKAVGK